MKNYMILLFLILGFSNCEAQKKDHTAWISLFNGKNLNGWRQVNGKADYKVIGGEIVGTSKAGEPNSFLATAQQYGDFILELELFIDPLMNSGIQFRSKQIGNAEDGQVYGYQMEVDPSSRAWSGGLYDEARRAWLYTLEQNLEAKKAFRNGSWNKYRIEAIGNTIRTWINGVPTANVVDQLTPKGFIALQVHSVGKNDQPGKQIKWRNIRIQTKNLLPTRPDRISVVNLVPNNLSLQEKENGFSLLFDGKSIDQWRGSYKSEFPSKGWRVNDGMLSVEKANGGESTNGGDIVTKKQYGAFEMKFDFKLTEMANSGVKYFVTESEGNKGSAIGLEYQVLDDLRHPDAKLGRAGNRTLGSLYDLMTSKKIPASQKKIGEWNQGIIKVFPDNNVEYWLNGYKILSFTRGSKDFLDLVAISKYKNWKNFGMASKGHILLQDHGDKVSFRSLKIRELN
ncbi:MAG: DUF1080 domain-containing protein [Pedobacter sp.]|nr:MAG: DUF1080 domain-containing protein [Pedobacter sp.]